MMMKAITTALLLTAASSATAQAAIPLASPAFDNFGTIDDTSAATMCATFHPKAVACLHDLHQSRVRLAVAYEQTETTDEQRAMMADFIHRNTVVVNGSTVVDFTTAQAAYFPWRASMVRTPYEPQPQAPHHETVGSVVAQILYGVVAVAVGAATPTYTSSNSFVDGRGHAVTVRCSTWVGSNSADTRCN